MNGITQPDTKNLIKVGDRFKTISPHDLCGKAILTVTKVENPERKDGWVYYKTDILCGRRRNHTARVWWFNEWCVRI